MHHLGKHEEVLKIMGDFFGDELHKVGDQLMETRVASNAGEGGDSKLIICFIEQGTANFFKVELQLFREDMFDQRLHGDVVVAADSSNVGVCTGAFGSQFLVSGVGCGGILGYRGLYTLYSEPMCYIQLNK